jgi:hypothetical protein
MNFASVSCLVIGQDCMKLLGHGELVSVLENEAGTVESINQGNTIGASSRITSNELCPLRIIQCRSVQFLEMTFIQFLEMTFKNYVHKRHG